MSAALPPILFTLAPPLLVAYFMALGRARGRLDWMLSALVCAGVALFVHEAGPIWFWIGAWWSWLPLGAAAVALLWSARKAWSRRAAPIRSRRSFAQLAARAAAAILFGILLLDIHRARTIPEGAVDLGFPLTAGRYAVVQGGASPLLNNHLAVPAQAHALDLVALNGAGRRARGIRPEQLTAYEIYDREVVSPCAGLVSAVADGAPDTAVGAPLPLEGIAGNHVLLSCTVAGRDITMLFAHLRAGSVAVEAGGEVERGALLGRVGNSGRSSEPHLHVHAVQGRERGLNIALQGGEAVPLTFAKRFFTRNSIMEIPEGTARRSRLPGANQLQSNLDGSLGQ